MCIYFKQVRHYVISNKLSNVCLSISWYSLIHVFKHIIVKLLVFIQTSNFKSFL